MRASNTLSAAAFQLGFDGVNVFVQRRSERCRDRRLRALGDLTRRGVDALRRLGDHQRVSVAIEDGAAPGEHVDAAFVLRLCAVRQLRSLADLNVVETLRQIRADGERI